MKKNEVRMSNFHSNFVPIRRNQLRAQLVFLNTRRTEYEKRLKNEKMNSFFFPLFSAVCFYILPYIWPKRSRTASFGILRSVYLKVRLKTKTM